MGSSDVNFLVFLELFTNQLDLQAGDLSVVILISDEPFLLKYL